MKLSFGMIFSIILIVIFIAVAFYAIKFFLGLQDTIKTGKFVDDLQKDINKMWKATQGSQDTEYYLPSKVEQICFVDYSSQSRGRNSDLYGKLKQVYNGDENLFFYPLYSAEDFESVNIKHINLEKITEQDNPFCVKSEDGKVKLTVEKNYDEATVVIVK